MVASIASSTLSLLLLIFYSYFADCLFPKSLLMILIFLMALATTVFLHHLLLPQDVPPPGIPSDIFSANLLQQYVLILLILKDDCTMYISRLTCPLMKARAALFLKVSPKNLRHTIASILHDLLCIVN